MSSRAGVEEAVEAPDSDLSGPAWPEPAAWLMAAAGEGNSRQTGRRLVAREEAGTRWAF
jgi:hypothetical protein